MNKELSAEVSNLKKKYGLSLPKVSEAGNVKRLILSSPQSNYIFGGGFGLGRIYEFFGPESGGKTVYSNYIGGEIQKRKDGGPDTVAFVDAEHTFDEKYANNAGLSTSDSNFILIRPQHGEEGFEIVEQMIRTGGIGLVIWDSIISTPSCSVMDSEYGKASFGKTAALFSASLPKIIPYVSRFNCSLIMINQIRDKIGGFQAPGMPKPENVPGGHAPKFYSSWRGRFSNSEDIMDGKDTIGNKIKIKNRKNKIGHPKRSAELDLYYNSGFNPTAEYIPFIVNLGLVEKKGGWYYVNGDKMQGVDKLLPYLMDHRDMFEEMKFKVTESFRGASVLDALETDEAFIEEDDNGAIITEEDV